MPESAPLVTAQEIRLTDQNGVVRMILSAKSGAPSVQLLQTDSRPGAAFSIDLAGRPSIQLASSDASAPTATFEIDDKGAHVKLDLMNGASSYLFLNNQGGSGVVLIDRSDIRRFQASVGPYGEIEVTRFDKSSEPGC